MLANLARATMTLGLLLVFNGCGGKQTANKEPAPNKPAKKKTPQAEPNPNKGKPKQTPSLKSKDPVTKPAPKDGAPKATTKQPSDSNKSVTKKTRVDPDEATKKNSPKAPAPKGGLSPREALDQRIAAFKVPPDWIADVQPQWDTKRPWKEARIEIRRLLGLNDETARRQGIRLTWDYLQKKDIGDGHEYGMYMFLGNEPTWAIIAFRQYVERKDLAYPPYFGLAGLASLYAENGVHEEGERLLKRALAMSPPKAAWKEMRKAEMHDELGDLYVSWGKFDKAREHYGEAMRVYPTARPPYGRHLIPRQIKKIQSKVDLIAMDSLSKAQLKDGTYRERAQGYTDWVNLTIQVRNKRVVDIAVAHKEKIDQGACTVIPRRIVDQQSLKVDGISGATVTKDAIISAALLALRRAGLK